MDRLSVNLHNTTPMPLAAAFDCASGELVALVGPSGSGKSSVLRAVAGLLRAPGLRGSVSVGDGERRVAWFDSERGINLPPQQRQVGLVFQHYALFPHLSAWQNVALAAGDVDAQALRPRLDALFARLGLTGLENRRPAQLSGGQQQRVALARALMRLDPVAATSSNAGVLLLDEPFSAVDAPTRQTLYRELASLRQNLSTPMLLVTHDLAEARRLADRVVILDAGTSLQTGAPAHVFASPRNARVAELVGIQNHFRGRFQKDSPGWAVLAWGPPQAPVRLRVPDKNRIDDGVDVTWVLAGELVDVGPAPGSDADGARSPAAADPLENTLVCTLREVLSLGETSLCTLEPAALPAERVTLNLSSALLRGLGAAPGSRLALHIAPAAVHIMPVRGLA
ncbi:MAG: ABC transporter ATP-binding protein [Burkholderiaceae bacterium]|nr:ABC transporter ATP-binding protein [Burkholderiaceae bacterium]